MFRSFGFTLLAAAIGLALMAETRTLTNAIGMELVLVPPGEFQMGCSGSDRECSGDEKPVHTVRISKPFYIGKFEVTQAQWKLLMGSNPSYYNEREAGAAAKDHPVEQVSWNAIQEFLEKLTVKDNSRKYRLPTEAEWEYAARAGTTDTWQGAAPDQVGWSGSNSGSTTHPVGQLKPNAWGIHDMLGNVWEWVQDGYDDKYYRTSPNVDPPGPVDDGSSHRSLRNPLGRGSIRNPLRKDMPYVIRGGSWYWNAKNMRVSWRQSYKADYKDYSGGFRVALDAE